MTDLSCDAFYQHAQTLGIHPMLLPDFDNHECDIKTAFIKSWLAHINTAIDEKVVALGEQALSQMGAFIGLRTHAVDVVLRGLFGRYLDATLSLFAIGGYGRGELLPCSDIDILILGETLDAHAQSIEQFVAMLWDIGITPAISVRTIEDTAIATTDHTVATALLEARLIAGNQEHRYAPKQAVKNAWSAKSFFVAKTEESKARYLSHHATEYNLEPNIKTAPGTLRDIHILIWLGKFYFDGVQGLADLTKVGFLSTDELSSLSDARDFLWCIRHHLHTITGRAEDRLLFDHQKHIAKRLHLTDETTSTALLTQALEGMMRTYYRHAMQVAALSEMLCAYYNESYLEPNYDTLAIDQDFYQITQKNTPIDTALKQDDLTVEVLTRHGKLARQDSQIFAKDEQIFIKKPETLLKIFLIMGIHGIKKIAASTLRALYLASHQIDEQYRSMPKHRALFLANLQEPNFLFHRLRLMKRYGILGNYLPAFGQIMGLMQYDLFHRYTVDAHTLLLIRILHRFGDTSNTEYQQKFDLVSEVYQKINRKDLLVIAAIFHDIAKGRGGDHSELGAVDVYEFAKTHGLDDEDTEFVAWLVREHLTMSLTAQKQDIFDPQIIKTFAEFTGTIAHLNHLYVLTVADMNATNSQLWNSWRASLLKQLYISTHRVLSVGIDAANKDTIIANRKTKAKTLMTDIAAHQIDELWAEFGDEFFLKQKHHDIAWQTKEILKGKGNLAQGLPIIALRMHSDLALNAVQLFICTQDQDDLFAATVSVLDHMGLSVLDATILTADIDGKPAALDSYVLIDRHAIVGSTRDDILSNEIRRQLLIDKLTYAFKHGLAQTTPRNFTLDTQLKHFTVPTQVQFSEATSSAHAGHHMMTLVTKDRPALLARLGLVFSRLGVEVHGARITTLGERAEDVFYLSDKDNQTLSADKLTTLKIAVIDALA
ncbi:MAG: [protein-PII] uridylyltransferase [Moraxella sp.]|nr:[protein-PII] uridylyltransferase [Moraxella sp.]